MYASGLYSRCSQLQCSSRRLQLNATKTKLIWFGTRHMLKKATENDLTLRLDSGLVHPVSAIRDLGATLDSELSMKLGAYSVSP